MVHFEEIRTQETHMEQFTGSAGYVASPELLGSVNIAMALEKPLLVKGEPGTGKTMLAQAVAEALGRELLIWSIKSTTKAQDGLYVYDTVQRLYDSQFGAGEFRRFVNAEIIKEQMFEKYATFGAQ